MRRSCFEARRRRGAIRAFAAGRCRSGAWRHLRRFAVRAARQAAAEQPALRSRLRPVRTRPARDRAGRSTKPEVRAPAEPGDRPRAFRRCAWRAGTRRPRATLLEPGLDGRPRSRAALAWTATPLIAARARARSAGGPAVRQAEAKPIRIASARRAGRRPAATACCDATGARSA